MDDGEPCGSCDSCVQIEQGSSLDVQELDAASNRGIEAMRDLIARTSLGTPGRWKIYIVDEVHMLTTEASNALLKTLEEPPAHVVFVLATTDPRKLLPTIRSRTQHFEFRLLPVETLRDLLHDINSSAILGVAPEAIDLVVRKGNGSARDALSVLDQVAAAGVIEDEVSVINEIVEALCEKDASGVLVAVAQGVSAGQDSRRLAADLLDHLRNGFLATMSKGLVALPDDALVQVEEQARRLGPAALVRSMETLGQALIDMRDAIDPRVILEVALMRVTHPEADDSSAAMLERLERLERSAARTGPNPPRASASLAASTNSAEGTISDPSRERTSAPAAGARAALGAVRQSPQSGESQASRAPQQPAPQSVQPPQSATPAGEMPSRDELTKAWGDQVLDNLPQKARARFRVGRFTEVESGVAVFALPNPIHKDRCEELRSDVEQVLSAHFGAKVRIKLVVEAEESSSQDPSGETSTSGADARYAGSRTPSNSRFRDPFAPRSPAARGSIQVPTCRGESCRRAALRRPPPAPYDSLAAKGRCRTPPS